jgi:hypothetical protein
MKKTDPLLIACFFLSGSMPLFAQPTVPEKPVSNSAQLAFLQKAVVGTSYSALVIHSKVEITPLPVRIANSKKVADDKTSEERHIYYARVLETFKGTAYPTIRYEVVVEKSEAAQIDTKPQLLTLCKGPRGFYWPGAGASFPGDVEMIAAARLAAKLPLKSATPSESQCG